MKIKIILLIIIIIISLIFNIEKYEKNNFLVTINYNNKINIYDLYSNSNNFKSYEDFIKDLKDLFNKEFIKNLNKTNFKKNIIKFINITDETYNFENILCQENIVNNYDVKYQIDQYDNTMFIDGFTNFLYKIYLNEDTENKNYFIQNLNTMFNKNICYKNNRNKIPEDIIKKSDLIDQTDLKQNIIYNVPEILEITIENNILNLYELINKSNKLIRKNNNLYKIPSNVKFRINVSNENFKLNLNNTYSLEDFKNSIILGKNSFNSLSNNNNELKCNNLKYNISCNVKDEENCNVKNCKWENNKCIENKTSIFNSLSNFIKIFKNEKVCKNLKKSECDENCQWYNNKCIPHTYNKKSMFSCSNDERIILYLNKNNSNNIGYIYYDLCPTSINGINIGQMNFFIDNCSSYSVITNFMSSYNKCNKYKTRNECKNHNCDWNIPPNSINIKNKNKNQCLPYNLDSYPFNYWITNNNIINNNK